MAQLAWRVIAVADSSELGRRAFATICAIGKVDILVTGATGDGAVLADLRGAGVDVLEVPVPAPNIA